MAPSASHLVDEEKSHEFGVLDAFQLGSPPTRVMTEFDMSADFDPLGIAKPRQRERCKIKVATALRSQLG